MHGLACQPKPGEGIPGAHNLPVGQVFFLPREEVTMRDCTRDEIAAIRASMEEFIREKDKHKQATPFGLSYSPLYAHRSSAIKSGKSPAARKVDPLSRASRPRRASACRVTIACARSASTC